MAALREVACVHGKRITGCDRELRAHEIDAGDRLRDRMFDLQARVHLEEVETGAIVAVPSTRNSTVPALR